MNPRDDKSTCPSDSDRIYSQIHGIESYPVQNHDITVFRVPRTLVESIYSDSKFSVPGYCIFLNGCGVIDRNTIPRSTDDVGLEVMNEKKGITPEVGSLFCLY